MIQDKFLEQNRGTEPNTALFFQKISGQGKLVFPYLYGQQSKIKKRHCFTGAAGLLSNTPQPNKCG